MKVAKYLVPAGVVMVVCLIVSSFIFPVDSNNVMVTPSWYPIALFVITGIPPLSIWLYEMFYFRSAKFKEAKESVSKFVGDCNELNRHIESLKNTALISNHTNYGHAVYSDNSNWSMSRPELSKRKNEPHIHNCSRTVCDNASKEPFKYICKYFNIPIGESTLSWYESILNNFEAAEDGKRALVNTRKDIVQGLKKSIPWFIRIFAKDKLHKKLGFEPVDLKTVYFPQYVFQYVSSGGNASTKCEVTMDIRNLNDFIAYLSDKIKFRNSVAGQRALMTSRLRRQIKERDGYACRYCGASVAAEPNLLLEIDHIVPVSKGGLTTESNLQTLCWRCNRSKGAKI